MWALVIFPSGNCKRSHVSSLLHDRFRLQYELKGFRLRLLNTRNRLTNILSGFWPRRHTNAFSKVCIFVVIENESIESRPHYGSDVFSSVHNKTFENDTIARCHVS